MKSSAIYIGAGLCLGAALAFAPLVSAQAPRGGGGRAGAPGGGGGGQPAPAHDYMVKAIPGVVADGAKWTLVWGGPTNADGLVMADDGGLLFAQEQGNRISKLDKNDKVSSYLENTHGTGAIAIDSKGRILGAMRTCTDPGGKPDECKEATGVGVLKPAFQKLADNVDGKTLGRVNDLVADKKGGIYFNGAATYYMDPKGKVTEIGENIRTNGIMLSSDEKTLYVTNGMTIVAFDVQPDGSVKNQRVFGMLEAGGGGDGLAIDADDRLYVSTGMGVQVLDKTGKYLGVIPTPRGVISVAFAGADKKTLYAVGSGAVDAEGKDLRTPEGVRNNAKSIYKIPVLTAGFKGRVK